VKIWCENGQLQSQREYARNQRFGQACAWYKNTELMLVEEYEADRLVSGKYFKLHKQDPISTVVNGNGLATLYDETGAFIRRVQYIKGKPVDLDN